MGKFIDLTGVRFGRLIVIKRVGSKWKKAYWLCKCDCGKEMYVISRDLITGHTKSCGCFRSEITKESNSKYKSIDLTGQRFNRWIVIKQGRTKVWKGKKRKYWVCKCNCGTIKEVNGLSLVNGTSKSCGCLTCEVAANLKRIESGLAAKRKVYREYMNNAKKRKLSFELSFEQFIELTQQNCYYCGSAPENLQKGNGNGDFRYNGIDRKDNSKGYTVENCVPCHERCNYMKRDLPYEDFVNDIRKIAIHLKLFNTGGENESKRISGANSGYHANCSDSFFC